MADPESSAAADRPGRFLERNLYGLLTGDEDARVCKDIPDGACNDQPRNFILQLFALSSTSIGDELANPKLVLPWLMNALGAPAFLLGWLVPVRESLALLPQLFIAAAMRRAPLRKWFWVAGSVGQGVAVLGMAVVALLADGAPAGFAILGLLVVFSLARGVCSVASKDVLGKTVSKTRRGTLSGYASSVAGLAALAAGLYAVARPSDERELGFFVVVLALGGGLWLVAAGVYAMLAELPGATEGGGDAGRAALANLALVRTDAQLRRFLITRALLVATALAAPFYVTLAQRDGGGDLGDLGLLILAQGAAGALSAAVWGRLSDRSSRMVLVMAGLIAGSLAFAVWGLVVLGWSQGPGQSWGAYLYAGVVFILGIAHAGVRVGRKTYLVDMATADNRAAYVAVSNTLLGAILVAGGLFGVMAEALGPETVILSLGVLSFAGAASAFGLREVTS